MISAVSVMVLVSVVICVLIDDMDIEGIEEKEGEEEGVKEGVKVIIEVGIGSRTRDDVGLGEPVK